MWIFGVTVLLMGVARAQQLTNELQHDAGYVETAPDQNYYTGQYAGLHKHCKKRVEDIFDDWLNPSRPGGGCACSF